MMRFRRITLITIPSLTLLLLPSVVRAQRFVAFAGGTNVAQGPALPFQSLSAGLAAQMSTGYRVAPRLRVRFDALVSHFTAAAAPVDFLAPVCLPPCGGSARPAAPAGSIGVAALAVTELIDVIPAAQGGPGFYLIAGGGAYYLFQHPTAPAMMRFGLSGGAGVELRLEGSSALFLEARYHGLMNAPADSRWLVPVTVGMRF
ncbi:MAG TPA: hypothetical protein VEU74_11265 [Gemmatimonadales bacterium]|nr:hypothetical protein [Gemmatimonadales bacterium]